MSLGFLVSATQKSSGKTVVSVGLGAALTARGHQVQTFKKGPDYIDPMWHSRATERACINLDFRVQTDAEILSSFDRYRGTADVAMVEGNKGLFDGVDTLGSDSNAAMAKLLGLPVVLVINTRGITRGIAPLALGYQLFDSEIQYAGVILNQIASSRHEQKLVAALNEYTDFQVFGSLPRHNDLRIEERHLGLIPTNEEDRSNDYIAQAAKLVAKGVDLDALLARATKLPEPDTAPVPVKFPKPSITVGIARDHAFGFYYADDLDAFRAAGAEVLEFDTLKDTVLPKVDALFLGGGFPETHIKGLSANRTMRDSINEFVESGKPVYAECGGLMYLSNTIEYRSECLPMVGAIEADTIMVDRPVGRGYARLKPNGNALWHTPGHAFNCHEFHYSKLDNMGDGLEYAYTVERGYGIDGAVDGLVYKNTLAAYCHQRHTQQNPWVDAFVAFVKHYRDLA